MTPTITNNLATKQEEKNMATMSIALTNLGKYNEGILDFVWLDLPASEEEIAAAFDQIEVSHDDVHYYSDGEGHITTGSDIYGEYEEFFITDYECDFMQIGEYENLDTLNEIAERMEGLSDYEEKIIEAQMENGADFEEALDNMDNCYFYADVDNESDLGYYFAEEYGALDRVPEDLRDFFDYEAYGRYLECSGTFVYVDGGCVEICR